MWYDGVRCGTLRGDAPPPPPPPPPKKKKERKKKKKIKFGNSDFGGQQKQFGKISFDVFYECFRAHGSFQTRQGFFTLFSVGFILFACILVFVYPLSLICNNILTGSQYPKLNLHPFALSLWQTIVTS